MSTRCSLGQPNNGNPSELKLNLYRTRLGWGRSRVQLCLQGQALSVVPCKDSVLLRKLCVHRPYLGEF